MNRREFIGLIGYTTIGWPMTVTAQQADKPRRVGVLMDLAENDLRDRPALRSFDLSSVDWDGPVPEIR
jgi:hypothetical protein